MRRRRREVDLKVNLFHGGGDGEDKGLVPRWDQCLLDHFRFGHSAFHERSLGGVYANIRITGT